MSPPFSPAPRWLRQVGIALIVMLFLAGLWMLYATPVIPEEEISLSTLVRYINEGKVTKLTVQESVVSTKLEGKKLLALKEPEASLTETLANLGVKQDKLENLDIKIKRPSGFGFWAATLLPFLLPFLLVAGFLYFMMRSATAASTRALSFGQARLKTAGSLPEHERVTFKDVAGCKEAKEELQEVVEFLQNPKRFTSLGAKIPKGVLLVGPPGTGKTLLARAVAGEAKVPFFHISGSEFIELFVGVGASRVRSSFARAKQAAPAIIFIDELDAVGRHRGAGLGGGHDEREQTLNQILVEMDGFDPNVGLVVLAATNRPDILDPALLRPGRFDRRVVLDLPDINEREAILKIHARKVPLAREVNLRRVAERTPGFSGADLANLINEAAILAARRRKQRVGMSELFASIEKVMLGPERKSRVLSPREKKIVAYHEAGHAIVAHVLPHVDPVQKISIVSRGRAGGYTLKVPEQERRLHTRSEFIEELATLLGGYAAELIKFNELTTGAGSDLKEATRLARKIVTEYGMSDLGPVTFGEKEELIFLGKELHETRNYSEKTAAQIDEEIRKLINAAHKKARNILTKFTDALDRVAHKLIEKEMLERDEFRALVKDLPSGHSATSPNKKTSPAPAPAPA